MKAIYQGRLWVVGNVDDWDRVVLESVQGNDTLDVPYSADGLIIDPTDGQIEALDAHSAIDMRPDASGRYTTRGLGEP